MRRELPRRLPSALDRIELGRVRRKAKELDAALVSPKPCRAVVLEDVARTVVDDDEELASSARRDELAEEYEERLAVEDIGEAVLEPGVGEPECAVDMSCFPLPICVYARLFADARPRLVERAVEPEARLVEEEDDSPSAGGFFLIAGSRLFTQRSCAARSAFASRLRGR